MSTASHEQGLCSEKPLKTWGHQDPEPRQRWERFPPAAKTGMRIGGQGTRPGAQPAGYDSWMCKWPTCETARLAGGAPPYSAGALHTGSRQVWKPHTSRTGQPAPHEEGPRDVSTKEPRPMAGPALLQGNDGVGEMAELRKDLGERPAVEFHPNSPGQKPHNLEIHCQEVVLYNQGWRPGKCP